MKVVNRLLIICLLSFAYSLFLKAQDIHLSSFALFLSGLGIHYMTNFFIRAFNLTDIAAISFIEDKSERS